MEVPRTWLDNYTASLNGITEMSQDLLVKQLRAIDYSRPVADIRQDVIGIMDACCGSASSMASAQGAVFYDGLRERVLGSGMGAYANDGRVSVATEKAVRAFLKQIDDGDYDAFETLCLDRVDYEVKRAAGRVVQYNVRRDPLRDQTRYARVPTGDETCPFCVMLASRGPIYLTEESAGAYDHYHPHCDCRIVPFWGTYGNGKSRRASNLMSIEGYDPDDLYKQWQKDGLHPAGSGSSQGARKSATESVMPDDDSRKLAQRLLRGGTRLSSKDEALDLLMNARTEWERERHSVDMDNYYASRESRIMSEYAITLHDMYIADQKWGF